MCLRARIPSTFGAIFAQSRGRRHLGAIGCKMATWADLAFAESGEQDSDDDVGGHSGQAGSSGDRPKQEVRSKAASSGSAEIQAAGPVSNALPSVAAVREKVAQAVGRKGRRSALLLEALAELAPKEKPARSEEDRKEERRRILANARADKKAKREAAGSTTAEHLEPCATLAVRPNLVELDNFRISLGLLKDLAAGTQGQCGPAPLAKLMHKFAGWAEVDPDVKIIMDEYCSLSTSMISSTTAKADKLKVDRRRLQETVVELASALVNADHALARALEESVAQSGAFDCLMYFESVSYDETPMQTKETDVVYDIASAKTDALAIPNVEASQGAIVKKIIVGSSTGPSKLFQTASSVTLVLRRRGGDDGRPPSVVLTTHPVTWVQVVESASVEVIKAALQSCSAVTVASRAFGLKVRGATSDRLAANLKAEASLVSDRQGNWCSLMMPCDIHRVSGSQTKMMSLVEDSISGMINLSLSLRLSGNMKRVRSCLIKVTATKLELLDRPPSDEAQAHREQCLDLFLSRGPNAARRRMLLVCWCNGDWRVRGAIQHYPGNGFSSRLTREQISKSIANALVAALAFRTPTIFARHRWTGADLAIDELGLMECVHGVLAQAYRAFLIACGHNSARSWDPMYQGAQAGGVGALQPAEDANGLGGDGGEGSGSDRDEMNPDPQDKPVAMVQGGAEAEVDWAAVNSAARRKGFAFIKGRPLGKLMVLRRCVEPFRVLLSRHFHLTSDKWETEQRAREIASLSPAGGGEPREFRVTVAASHALEDTFLEATADLLASQDAWRCLPPECRSIGFQSLVFKLLSRMGSAVHELLYKPHDRFPYRLFLLLEDPSLAEVFQDAPSLASLTPSALPSSSSCASQGSTLRGPCCASRRSAGN